LDCIPLSRPSLSRNALEKEGVVGVNSGQVFTATKNDLRTINRHAAFYAQEYSEFLDSGGATWSGTERHQYVISSTRFDQCFDDNTNCDLAPNFVPLDFNGFLDMTVVLGPKPGERKFVGLAPKPKKP
jgi:hypothetical protein